MELLNDSVIVLGFRVYTLVLQLVDSNPAHSHNVDIFIRICHLGHGTTHSNDRGHSNDQQPTNSPFHKHCPLYFNYHKNYTLRNI